MLEPAVRAEEPLPEQIRSISMGLDRTTAPMEELLVPPPPRRPRKKPYARRAPAPVQVCYRMTYVDTVALHGPGGDCLQTYRYFASPEEGPCGILSRMMEDVCRVRAQCRNVPLVVVQDGAPEMWNRVTDALSATAAIRTWHEVLDRFHLDERLAGAARILARDDDGMAREVRDTWRAWLDADDDGILAIKREIELSLDEFSGKDYDVLHDANTHISNNAHRMRYVTLRARHLPIASGITEAACKTMVAQRAKRSGQRWHPAGLRAVIALRTQLLNQRLGPCLSLLRGRKYSAVVKLAA